MASLEISTTQDILPYIIGTAIAAFFIEYLRRFIIEWFNNRERKKKRSIWINFLRSNEIINKCTLTYEKIKSDEGIGRMWYSVLGFILGIIGYLFLIIFLKYLLESSIRLIAYSSIICLVPYFSVLILYRYFIKNKENIIDKSDLILNYIKLINWFIFGSGGLMISYIYLIYMNSSQIQASDLALIRSLFVVSISVIMISFYFLNFTLHNQFFNHIKYILNKQYRKNFPYISITTKAGEVKGNIQDVFHNDLIILEDDDVKMVAEWDEISNLKLRTRKTVSTDLSYYY